MTDIDAGPYAQSVAIYREQGWPAVLPVEGKARQLPMGYTGHHCLDPSSADMLDWQLERGQDNVVLRMPPDVIGIDVDNYGNKQGAETLLKAMEAWGVLPKTYRSTARGKDDPRSGIYFFRWPHGFPHNMRITGKVSIDGQSDIETIHFDYRFAVVWPSVHPETGEVYQWYDLDGLPCSPPSPDDLPVLPVRWAEELVIGELADAREAVLVAPQHAATTNWTTDVRDVYNRLVKAPDAGSRHDELRIQLTVLCRLEAEGHTGATSALEAGRVDWVANMGEERSSHRQAPADVEYDSLLKWAREMVATTDRPGDVDVFRDQVAGLVDNSATEPEEDAASPFLSELDIYDLPPPKPLIHAWLYRETLAVLYGPPKKGKTFVAIDIAMAVATGSGWAGGDVEAGNVLYCLGEGLSGLGRRMKAWRTHHHIDEKANLWITGSVPQLSSPEDVAQLLNDLGDIRPDLIVIDTLARAAIGVEENSSKEMGMVIAGAELIKEHTGACVLLVHHTGKDTERGLRGSSALAGAIDSGIQVEGDTKAMHLHNTYQKDAEPAEPFQLSAVEAAESIVMIPNKFVASVVLDERDEEERQKLAQRKVEVASKVRDMHGPDTSRGIATRVGLSAALTRQAIALMIDEGALIADGGTESRPKYGPNPAHHLFDGGQ